MSTIIRSITLLQASGLAQSFTSRQGSVQIYFAGIVFDPQDLCCYRLSAPVEVVSLGSDDFQISLRSLGEGITWPVTLPPLDADTREAIVAVAGPLDDHTLWEFATPGEAPTIGVVAEVDADTLWPDFAASMRRRTAALAADSLDAILAALGFTHTYDLHDSNSIAALTTLKRRSGIYVLHFPDNSYYVGQSKDVAKRLAQHRRTYTNIAHLSFKALTLGQEILDLHEQEAIYVLEDKAYPLLNVIHTSITYQSSELDLIITPQEQRQWLAVPHQAYDHAPCERKAIEKNQRLKYQQKFHAFQQRSDWQELVACLRQYVAYAIPQPHCIEHDFWSISCLPSTNASTWPRLACFNMNAMEVFVIGHHKQRPADIWAFINLSAEILLDAYPTTEAFIHAHPHASLRDSSYVAAGIDQIAIQIEGLAALQRILNDPAVLSAARLLNLHLMRKRTNLYARYHCFDLADLLV
jgi:hypothetical protein